MPFCGGCGGQGVMHMLDVAGIAMLEQVVLADCAVLGMGEGFECA